MKAKFLVTALLTLFVGASIAEAQRGGGPRPGPGFPGQQPGHPGQQQGERIRININMGDQQYTAGSPDYIGLRDLIRQQRPNLQLNRYRLESVSVLAKSRQGQGQIALLIDNRRVGAENVPGNPGSYDRPGTATYSNIQLRTAAGDTAGTWRLEVRGNVKIREITAVVREIRGPVGPGPGPGVPSTQVVNVAEDRFDKVIADMNVHNVRVDNVRELRISTVEKPIRIHEMAVTFANGSSQRFALNADIVRGRDLRVQIGNRDVRTIRIIGTSLDLFGSRAHYKIEAVVLR